jgi:dihydroflavonol-4-reductase
MLPRMAAMLARGRYVMAGAGHNHIHLAHVGDVVQGLLLAGESEQAIGQTYILAGPAPIRMNELVGKLCALLQVYPPRWRLPAPPLWLSGALLEIVYNLKNRLGIQALGQTPFLTRSKVNTVTLDSGFSTAKARAELGYQPRVDYDQGLPQAVEWYCAHDLL